MKRARTQKFHVYESIEYKYEIILSKQLLTSQVIDIKISEHKIVGGAGPYKGYTSHMKEQNNQNFKLYDGKKPEEYFLGEYNPKYFG